MLCGQVHKITEFSNLLIIGSWVIPLPLTRFILEAIFHFISLKHNFEKVCNIIFGGRISRQMMMDVTPLLPLYRIPLSLELCERQQN